MTDTSFPVKAINGPDLSRTSFAAAYPSRQLHYHAPAEIGIPEDDGQISCICGFADDDGWTVACDLCNKWQHQSCYYPQYDELTLPEEVQHYCVECRPRPVDSHRARQRQVQKREHTEQLANGVKRVSTKSHKKKVKDPPPQTNGWPVDKLRHDRNSASPRDQPPPAKRPKTNRRASDSTTTTTNTTTKGHSRKRNASNVNHRRSLSRSPDSPIEQYSEEFLQCYQDDDWKVTDANLYNSIAVTNSLSAWLNCHEDEFRTAHKQEKGDVLMRWDGNLDDIPGKAQIQIVQNHDESVQYQGLFPAWKTVTVQEPVPSGAYIGELKGHVGFKKEYQDENRWSTLRHPEPFVFFHPKLPIFIDARNEGTELRYIRRSCMPNARLQALITENVNYHFCFMATQQIEPGTEVAVGWDTADGLPELASRSGYSDNELEILSAWVSTALANCGPCACSLPEKECMMSRFDRRIKGLSEESRPPKPKKRKAGQHISPLNTHVNSRSGSEARKVDVEDDGTDSRSTSGSAGRGSASRDITPNTHYSTNGHYSGKPELSERERKKLAKEEEIFRRQEEEQAGKQAKKKRNSGGSNLNTPSATTSKQLGFPPNNVSRYVDAVTSRQAGLPAKGGPGRKPKAQKAPARPVTRVVKRAKPAYVNAEAQCDMDKEDADRRAATPSTRRPFISTRQRLLNLCAQRNAQLLSTRRAREATASPVSITQPVKMEVDHRAAVVLGDPPSPAPAPAMPAENAQSHPSEHEAFNDVEMEDAPASEETKTAPSTSQVDTPPKEVSDQAKTSLPVEPPAPPWPQEPSSAVSAEVELSATSHKPANMHLQMPPPPTNPFTQPAAPLSSGTTGSASNSIVQSPATLGPNSIFSPSVSAAVAPSPVRKKLSLSDYTRRKAKDKDNEAKAERESSPASTTSGPVVPPLQPSSSSEVRAAQDGSAIDEDVRMEDAGGEENKP
ncbi:SET domain-containing 3 [Lecanosticta acicola]|uniref:SET domain-containing 3 n=1 Tax=Lecanosticta acicola TaxID=111012 RepID=A0AAI8Z3Y3_9PEZI|nr:SET domain-containing 3 [Lecanosticta acicola]